LIPTKAGIAKKPGIGKAGIEKQELGIEAGIRKTGIEKQEMPPLAKGPGASLDLLRKTQIHAGECMPALDGG
jgi:hypothetical protein